jgi:dihydroxyacetone kinase-like protein
VAREAFRDSDGEIVVREMIRTIRENAGRLSEIDGAIGDGDHGINMNKGFTLCAERLEATPGGFLHALRTLASVLETEIGGAMGPLYGALFSEMALAAAGEERITAELLARMLARGTAAVIELGGAKVGDKTMVDVLAPAARELSRSVESGAGFRPSLAAMAGAALQGRESTRDLVARLGRASRLGERSRGVHDAGASSSALLLDAMARSMTALLSE